MIHLLTDSLRRIPLENHVDEDGHLVSSVDGAAALSDSTLAGDIKAKKIEATFKAVQDKFDIIE